MEHKNNGFSLADLIDIGALITILVALIYTAGWSYAYHYFFRFHLGLLGLEIKREYFFLYGFWVLKDKWLFVLACLVGIAGLAFLFCYLWQPTSDSGEGGGAAELYAGAKRRGMPPGWHRPVVWVAAPTYIFLLFVVFYQLGVETGYARFKHQLDDDFPSYPRVKVWLATKKSEGTTKEEETFYENWLGGPGNPSPLAALHRARLAFIKHENEAYRDPEVWSSFVLVGR